MPAPRLPKPTPAELDLLRTLWQQGPSTAKQIHELQQRERPDLPYAHLRSSSTGQPFCLFIAHGPQLATAVVGHFNTYGLGPHASIPWF